MRIEYKLSHSKLTMYCRVMKNAKIIIHLLSPACGSFEMILEFEVRIANITNMGMNNIALRISRLRQLQAV